jgi:serine/threonine-protein kinase
MAILGVVAWIVFGPGNGPRVVQAGGLDPRRVAVLYFEDRSADSSLGYLADGLTEAVIDALAPVRPLDVVSRYGVGQFRGANLPRDSIARVLGAGTLLAGSVEAEGVERLRVSTRLVEGASGADFARRSFTLPRADPLAIRDSAVQDITSFLRSHLGEEIELRERRGGTSSPEAWGLVQRAERLRKDAERLSLRDRAAAVGTLAQADTLLADAQARDPRWSDPAIGRGWVAYDAGRYVTDREARLAAVRQGLEHAERAVAMDRTNPRALEIRGTLRYALWRLEGSLPGVPLDDVARLAHQDLDAAVRAEPTLASAHWTLSLLYHFQKDIVSSVLAARNAYQADGFLRNADAILERLAFSSYNIMQFAESRRWCQEGERRFPREFRFVDCHVRMLITPDARPDVDLAWRLAARADSVAPDRNREFFRRRTQMFVGGAIARAGLRDSARNVLARARAGPDVDPNQELVGYEAIMRTLMGEQDTAIAMLKRYVAANPGHSFEVGGDIHWWWRDLRTHPEFRSVLAATR